MADCCSDNDDKKQENDGDEKGQDAPKSFFRRFFYNIGKKDLEKNKGESKGGGCC